MPEIEQVLDLESRSRHLGSGLKKTDLLGSWWLDRVAKRGSDTTDLISSSLLRALGARLELGPASGDQNLSILNSVRLGGFCLRFEGSGRLEGNRPLLRFSFDRVLLLLGPWRVLERRLPQPARRESPFFALIASGREQRPDTGQRERWLAARGRSGGIAIWYQREVHPTLSPDSSGGKPPRDGRIMPTERRAF